MLIHRRVSILADTVANKLIQRGAGDRLKVLLAEVDACYTSASPAVRRELALIARQLAGIQKRLSRPKRSAASSGASKVGESDDERLEREDAASARRIDAMLSGLNLTALERQFAENVGERLVEMVADAYVQVTSGTDRYDPACITAAVIVALMVVYDPPEEDPAA